MEVWAEFPKKKASHLRILHLELSYRTYLVFLYLPLKQFNSGGLLFSWRPNSLTNSWRKIMYA